MNRIGIRNRKKAERKEDFKEKAGMIIIGTIFLLIIAFLALTPLVFLGYVICIGELFTIKSLFQILFMFLYSWGFLFMIFSNSL